MATGRVPDLACTWAPLHAALQQHVRIPLLRDHSEDWKDTSPTQIGEKFTRKGQISVNDSRETALWYTLAYSCLHFDALRDLMRTDEFKEVIGFHDNDRRSILHVDFGCGPGTSAWAITKEIPDMSNIETIGYDHNSHMTDLAKSMVHTIAESASKNIIFDFLSDWRRFHRRVMRGARNQDLFLVTVNSLFGQQTSMPSELNDIIDVIKRLRTKSQSAPMLVFGTHPSWSIRKVNDSWEKIAEEIGATMIYNQAIQGIFSESPIKYTQDIRDSWYLWDDPKPQLAHILMLPPAGGKR